MFWVRFDISDEKIANNLMLSLTLLNESDKLVLIQSHTFLGFLMPDSRDMVAGIFTLQKVRNGFYE